MPQSLSRIYLHIVFSTKNREKLIPNNLKNDLYSYFGGILRKLDCTALQIGGTSNHMHILCIKHRTITEAKVVEEIKKSTSKWIKTKDHHLNNFYWQNGYGVFSVCPSILDNVKNYIIRQEEHHKKETYKEEFRKFLDRYGIDYDERYIWD